MRVHIQNDPDDHLFAITSGQWDDACARSVARGAVARGAVARFGGEQDHRLSIGATPADLRQNLPEVELLITAVASLAPLRHDLPAAPSLRFIACTSAGLDRLAPFDWLPDGVALLNNRGVHGAKAGEYGLMALLMLAAGMPQFATQQRAGIWAKRHGSILAGRAVTVVGLGALGGAIATQARRFGMRVTGVRTTPRPHPACDQVIGIEAFDQALPGTEFLVLAAPHTPATTHLLDARRIALLPRAACVINVGRGALIEQAALCDALDAGRLDGAVLDVFSPEPVPPGHRLWTTRNLVMTPHVSADDPLTYNPDTLDLVLENLRAWREGQPMPNRIDTGRYY